MSEAGIAERIYSAAEYIEKVLAALQRADRIARARAAGPRRRKK